MNKIERLISFSPPDISEKEIESVAETLRSGWITTGPKTKLFEKKISEYCKTSKTVCLNSATAALELTLRFLGIGPGDEVITSAYTYTASASVIHHVGAKIILVDTKSGSLEMDYDKLANAITEKTKVVIPVDVAGIMCDYDELLKKLNQKSYLFNPSNDIQKCFNRCIVLADAAHSFGATYKGKVSGQVADFTAFSFHAVKNLTTGEGGAITWLDIKGYNNESIYKEFQLLSLHGQNKDALTKSQLGSWEYDIIYPAFKCNMTDLMSSLGLVQLERYDYFLNRRKEIIMKYNNGFKDINIQILDHYSDINNSSGHLYITRVLNADHDLRNHIISGMASKGISCNVHYKPLPLMTAYIKLGYNIVDYPNAYNFYSNEISLPLHTLLTDSDIDYIIENFKKLVNENV